MRLRGFAVKFLSLSPPFSHNSSRSPRRRCEPEKSKRPIVAARFPLPAGVFLDLSSSWRDVSRTRRVRSPRKDTALTLRFCERPSTPDLRSFDAVVGTPLALLCRRKNCKSPTLVQRRLLRFYPPRWNHDGRAGALEDHQVFLQRFAKVKQGQARRHSRRGRSISGSDGFLRPTTKSAQCFFVEVREFFARWRAWVSCLLCLSAVLADVRF